ncbi:hypothetical protein SAMN04488077_10767 [Roseovarius tolerans]|uniref:Uncharacterized protein n=1 Tax=Roseovarius tolerans TaxID=74031 RepID=A0A1H8AN15_9RHOB|nr:hypothetical protein [Roseovarius tolerans]SEM70917.1 hypothetical protein SAMN04488077_10767 [Roseovarius tolerans]
MTLILTVQTKGSIWLVADRRLSASGQAPIDDAIKCTIVEVADGIALLGYAGLGATARGSQPSQWVSNVLRGRHHPLEQMLQVVSDAMKREFLPHLEGIRDAKQRQHNFVVPAFLNEMHRVYTIDLAYTSSAYKYRYTRHIMGGALTPMQVTTPIGLAGSGAGALPNRQDWQRPLLRLVKAYNGKRITAAVVAHHLAKLAYRSCLGTPDGSVGPDSLVVWRNSKAGLHRGGGGHSFFANAQPSSQRADIPSISKGMDMTALVKTMMEVIIPQFEEMSAAKDRGEEIPEFDGGTDEINRRLRRLPSTPDEKLP